MKKILITNAFGPQNRGDHELLQRLLELIIKNGKDEGSIVILTTNPIESQKEFPQHTSLKSAFYKPSSLLESVKLGFDSLFWLFCSYLPFLEMFLSKERKEKLQLYKNADLIVMCPGGYMYSNKLALYVNIFNCLPFKRIKGKIIAAPMSVGPFHNTFDKILCKYILSKVDEVFMRESYSLNLVREMGVDAKFCHDLAWISDSSIDSVGSWDGHYVGTVIDWEYPNLDSIYYKERFISEYIVAATILAEKSGKPFIIYNQVGDGSGFSADEILINEIVKRGKGQIVFDSSAGTPYLLKSKIKSSKGLIASRFHSALFAIQALTPFCSIAYQPKAEYILKDLNLSNLCFDISSFRGEDIADKLMNIDKKENTRRLLLAQEDTVSSIMTTFSQTLKNNL